MEIYLCILDRESQLLLQDDYTWEVLLRNMSLKERQGVLSIKNEQGRMVKALNLLIFNYVMKKAHPNVQTEIVRGAHGKPLDSRRNCGFNLSDEDGMVALALNLDGSQIGIDLATSSDIDRFEIKPEAFVDDDFKEIFTVAERSRIHSLFENCRTDTEKNYLLSQYWALKESYCKYLGLGITFGLEKYQFLDQINMQGIDPVDFANYDFKPIANGDNGFAVPIGQLTLHAIEGYAVKNALFSIGDSGVICSVFGTNTHANIFQINVPQMVMNLIA